MRRRPRRPCTSRRQLIVVTLLAVLLGKYVVTTRKEDSLSSFLLLSSEVSTATITEPPTTASPLQRLNISGVDVLLQAPPSQPKGLLFLGHGCNHKNIEFFPPTQKDGVCPDCIGMPEEMAIVRIALQHFQLVVAAFSSQGSCWKRKDADRVAPALKQIVDMYEQKSSINPLPILAFGASMGGDFVGTHLSMAMQQLGRPLTGFIAAIGEPDPLDYYNSLTTTNSKRPIRVPVAVYITMTRDKKLLKTTQRIVERLQEHNYPVQHIRIDPISITDSFFHDRIAFMDPFFTQELSTKMVQALTQAGLLTTTTNNNKILRVDPQSDVSWATPLRPLIPIEKDKFIYRTSPTWKVLNAAYARHEIARDGVQQAIEYIVLYQNDNKSQAGKVDD